MIFEIINPSDKAFIEADDTKVAAIATVLFGKGMYGLKQIDGDFEMPTMLFGGGGEWFKKTFGEAVQVGYENIDWDILGDCLLTVRLAGERTSLNDLVGVAHGVAARLKDKAGG